MIKHKFDFLDDVLLENYFLTYSQLTKVLIGEQIKHGKSYTKDSLQELILRFRRKVDPLTVLKHHLEKVKDIENINIITIPKNAFDKITTENSFDFTFKGIKLTIKPDIFYKIWYKDYPENLLGNQKPYPKKSEIVLDNVLIIGDLHTPFDLDAYFNFCVNVSKKYNTTKTIFIGDIIDNHAISNYSPNPDGYSAGDELKLAKKRIQKWYKQFPNATVTEGNHCQRISKKVLVNGIPSMWIRELKDVLETPNWDFVDEYEYQNIVYIHGYTYGEKAAFDQALYRGKSVIQGHVHSQSSIIYVNQNVFGAICGSGIDNKKYAFNYSRGFKKAPMISCIVVIDGTPIIETMR